MLEIETINLITVPLRLDMLQTIMQKNRVEAESIIGYKIHRGWPNQDFGEILSFFMEQIENGDEIDKWNSFVVHKRDGIIIGDAGLKGGPDDQGVADIGFGIISHYQGLGYATELVSGISNWAFHEKNIKGLTANCVESNLASIRVLEKTGFGEYKRDNGFIYWKLSERTI